MADTCPSCGDEQSGDLVITKPDIWSAGRLILGADPQPTIFRGVAVTFAPPTDGSFVRENSLSQFDYDLQLPTAFPELPSFELINLHNNEPINFGDGLGDCSKTIPSFTVDIIRLPATTACGFQIIDCRIYAVGDGYISCIPDIETVADCGGTITILLNGQAAPISVTDGENVVVSLSYAPAFQLYCPGYCLDLIELCPVHD